MMMEIGAAMNKEEVVMLLCFCLCSLRSDLGLLPSHGSTQGISVSLQNIPVMGRCVVLNMKQHLSDFPWFFQMRKRIAAWWEGRSLKNLAKNYW